jgi:hypothetical protein
MTQVSDVAPGPLVYFFRTTGPILTRLGINHPWGKGIKIVQIKGQVFQRRDNHKNAKIGCGHLKIVFSRTTWPEKLRFT